MGKKALLKVDLSYDDEFYEEDDDIDYCSDENDDDAESDSCDPDGSKGSFPSSRSQLDDLAGDRSAASTFNLGVFRQKQEVTTKLPEIPVVASLSSHHDDGYNYLKWKPLRPGDHCSFSTLDNDTIIHIAKWLPLQSIMSLSCVNKLFDGLLALDFLYCVTQRDDGRRNLLPCVRSIPNLLPLEFDGNISSSSPARCSRPKGLSRKFAIESSIYSPKRQEVTTTLRSSRGRSFKLCSSVDLTGNSNVENFSLNNCRLSYVAQSFEITSQFFKQNNNPNRKHTTSSDRHQRPTAVCSTMKLPNCDYLLRSSIHDKTSVCAMFSSPSGVNRSYALSLVSLPLTSDYSPHLVWHHDNILQPPLFTESYSEPILQFNANGSNILFGSTEHCSVVDTKSGEKVWEIKDTLFDACTIHDEFVVGLENYKLKIYDVRKRAQVAGGSLPHRSTFSQNSLNTRKTIKVFGGRVWIASSPELLCSNRFVRDISDSMSTNSMSFKLQVETIGGIINRKPLLCCHGNYIYVADGRLVKSYDRRNVRIPCKVYAAGGLIDDMQVDDTKLVCVTTAQRSHRIEIIPIDSLAKGGSNFESVVMHLTDGHNHGYKIHSIRLHGRFLAAYHSFRSHSSHMSKRGEIQIYDILHEVS